MNLHSSRRRLLKLIGIGTASTLGSLLFGKFLHRQASTLATNSSFDPNQTSTLALEKLLLETGKEHLPQGLYNTTLHQLNISD